MSVAQTLLPEFDHEMANTRIMLERFPADKADWTPDPKSMTMSRLACHIVDMPGWGSTTLTTDELNLTPESSAYGAKGKTSADILAVFDKNVAEARAALAGASDEALMAPWSLKFNGNAVFTMPRVGVIRAMVINHVIHHRGQLTVYYRLNGVSIPALYGPSADEGRPA